MPTPRNVFATNVGQTRFNVTNNSGQNLGNQYILVYLTPLDNAENWLYVAWQQLRPGPGSTKSFFLNQNVSGSMLSQDGLYETNRPPINPNYVSLLTNAAGLDPSLQPPVLGSTVAAPTVTGTQSGIKNMTATPGTAMFARWFLNDNLTCQSIAPVSAGGTLSAFELNTVTYWAVGNLQKAPTYTYQQITTATAYSLPPATDTVDVSLTYNASTQQFEWTFAP